MLNKDRIALTWLLIVMGLISCSLILFAVGCQLPVEPLVSTNPAQALTDTVAKTNWVIALSIAGIAFSVMAWINGSKTAIGVLVGCIVALWLQITIVRYASILAWVGLIAAIGLGIWTVFVKNRALKEIVIGIQKYKKDYLGPTAMGSCLKRQNKTTQKIVSQIKGEKPGKKV